MGDSLVNLSAPSNRPTVVVNEDDHGKFAEKQEQEKDEADQMNWLAVIRLAR